MTENQNNIWNKIEVLPKTKKVKKFYKKCIKIKQIEKDKILPNGTNNVIPYETTKKTKTMFINKKRGRISKSVNEVSREGIHDRFSDDNLKRKVKTHFHNYIIALLNSKLVIKPTDKLIKFGKMKSNITQNITVEYNQKLFNKKIKEIITEVSNKYQNKFINSECINYVMRNPKENEAVIKYLEMTYKDMYLNYYLKSTKKDFPRFDVDESYEAHKEKLKQFGDKYLLNYIKNAEGLIEFYNKCKKRRSRKKPDSEPNDGINEILLEKKENKESKESTTTAYLYDEENIQHSYINNGDYNESNLKKNMICVSTQTDMKIMEDETETENEY